jgi:hypothetical protein
MISEEKLRKIVRDEIAKWYDEEVVKPELESLVECSVLKMK